MKGNDYGGEQKHSDDSAPLVLSQEQSSMPSETSSLVELYLTKKFLSDLSKIHGRPVATDDYYARELVHDCVMHDHLSENVTPEIRVLRLGTTNEKSIFYSRVTSVVRVDGKKIFFRKYIFVKASVGHKFVDRNSSKLNDLGKVLTAIMMTGVALNKAHTAFEKIKDLARSLIMNE